MAGRGENIRNWIKVVVPDKEKPKRYRSKYDPKAPVPNSTFRREKRVVGTFGRLTKDSVDPKKYLKGGERCGRGVDPKSKPSQFRRQTPAGGRKAKLPGRDERPVHGVKSKKNYVVANAVDNILAVPPARTRKEEMNWTQKKEYGKVPEYLSEVKAEIEGERELIQTMMDMQEMEADADEPRYREMGDDEREDLLDALKAKWDSVNFEFQKISFKNISTSSSSIGQIRAKEQCETQMKQLEKDIARLETKGPIYVLEDE